MNDNLRKIIFKKLYSDLSYVEIINFDDRIWFIDRKEKYWYFEYKKSGVLWWRYDFFTNFFKLFSIEQFEFEPIISDWVEEVLNCEVTTTVPAKLVERIAVEEVLNHKVTKAAAGCRCRHPQIEKVLNDKVTKTYVRTALRQSLVEEVLNHNKK
jgi:hypothetical protein